MTKLTLLPIVLAGAAILSMPAFGQRTTPASTHRESDTTTGVVSSSSNSTMIVRTESGEHILVVLNRDTQKPASIPVGSTVRVTSRMDDEGIRVARRIQVTAAGSGSAAAETGEPVPDEVRKLESQIQRQVRRFRMGVRAGAGLNPEILTAGVHAKMGPFFHRDVFFRPNAEFGFGEVTKLVALNLEAVYRLPLSERQSRWSAYIGAGPGFNFIDRNFEEAESGDRSFDFNDFDFEASLNVLAGIEFRSGMFLEVKSAVYSRPQVRLLIGYSF